MKVKNIFKRTFLREFHFTFDRFYYFFKINKHHDMVNNFKKKKFNYIVRIFLKLITFQFVDSLKIISKLIAFSKFIDLIKKREMAEWFKAHAWKVCIRETVSRVRIPLSLPLISFI